MKNKPLYHSALKGFEEYRDFDCSYFQRKGFWGIQYDLESTQLLPDETLMAGFLYTDLPFQRGYEIFNKRTGKTDGKGWKNLVTQARRIAIELGIPYFFMGDKSFASIFNTEYQFEMKWEAHKTNGLIFTNTNIMNLDLKSNDDLIRYLFSQHKIGLDIACGYGHLTRKALECDGYTISMDINPYCIGYIYKEILGGDVENLQILNTEDE
jgi:hypothetical protein